MLQHAHFSVHKVSHMTAALEMKPKHWADKVKVRIDGPISPLNRPFFFSGVTQSKHTLTKRLHNVSRCNQSLTLSLFSSTDNTCTSEYYSCKR